MSISIEINSEAEKWSKITIGQDLWIKELEEEFSCDMIFRNRQNGEHTFILRNPQKTMEIKKTIDS